MARNRQLEQLGQYAGFRIPKTVVTNFKSGRWGIETLIKSINKFNDTSNINMNDWALTFRRDFESGTNLGLSRSRIFEDLVARTRRVSFFNSEDLSFSSAVNEAFYKIPDSDETKKQLQSELGKHINFMDWKYNETNQTLEYFDAESKIMYSVNFIPSRNSGEYDNMSNVLNVERTQVII